MSVCLWLVVLLPAIALLRTWYCLLKNINTARNSGLKYVVVPIYNYNTLALTLTRPFFQLLDRKWPNPTASSWRRLCGSAWLWKCRHASFVELGTDNFLVVSPGGIIMYTADADVISQITERENDFPKAVQLYKPINIYGENIVTSTGAAWRRHRRLTAMSFSEKNNELVWKETLFQTQKLLAFWIPGAESHGKPILDAGKDAMRLSLSVISRAALGQRIDLFSGSGESGLITEQDMPEGHTMTFSDSLQTLLSRILVLMIFPRWLLRIFPSKAMAQTYKAYDEWGKYMREMAAEKAAAIANKTAPDTGTTDLISQFLKTKVDNGGIDETEQKGNHHQPAGLTDSEIIGNMFVLFIAGHETSANSIHFSLLLLALHPATQKAVQEDLDRLLQGRPLSSLSYRRDFPLLSRSLLGAVLAEQLRLITPVLSIPKCVGSTPQPLIINDDGSSNGRKVVVPPHTIVRLAVHSVHRNPRFWPSGPPRDPAHSYFPPSNPTNDLEEFKPQRWTMPSPSYTFDNTTDMHSEKHSATITSTSFSSSSSTFHTPPPGAYLPFSAGQRACSGQRFAQVEILCALATILSQYTVELCVDDFAAPEVVNRMGFGERKEVWMRARERAQGVWQQKMQCVLTLQIRGASVPVRVVRRGCEVFDGVDH